jgi:hypothetical protein
VDVVGGRVYIVSRVPGSQGSRVNGSQGLNSFKGTKSLRVSGFQGKEGLLHINWAFLRSDASKIQRSQGPRDKGFLGSKVQGLKG